MMALEPANHNLEQFATVERLLAIRSTDNGMPPTLNALIKEFNETDKLFRWCAFVAEVLDYIAREDDRNDGRFFDRFLISLQTFPSDKHDALDFYAAYSWLEQLESRVFSDPVARVLQANHTNPLEVLILVSAPVVVSLLIGGAIAYAHVITTRRKLKENEISANLLMRSQER